MYEVCYISGHTGRYSVARVRARMVQDLDALPSVYPKQKTGHWINKSRRSGCGILFVESECTCCGKKTPFNCDEFLYRYCPNCGAKMIEPQESEDKE